MKTCQRSIICRVAALYVGLALTGIVDSAPPTHGLDLAGIDHTVQPGVDFFEYANGTWLKSAQIPADRSTYGIDAMLVELTNKRTVALIQEADAHGAAKSPEARQIADYYASFMDEAAIEKLGLRPLAPRLARIAAIADRKALAQVLGASLRADVDALNSTNFYTDNLFGLWVAQDLNEPSRYAAYLLQGGLGMPDRDYYLNSSALMAAIRDKYRAHIALVLKLAHTAAADAKAARIFDLERRIAVAHWPRVDSEDVLKGNNHWTRRDFQSRAPGLDWQSYFKAALLDARADFTVWQPSAVSGISALVASQPLATWKDYLEFHALEHASNYLPKAFVEEDFAFNGQVLAGTPALRERWKRGVSATSEALGEAVGKLYVQHYFLPAEKARVEAMVKNLVVAFGARIDKLDWMAAQTKIRAKQKLATLKVGVGYPDKWRDYSALKVIRGDALGNAERAERLMRSICP